MGRKKSKRQAPVRKKNIIPLDTQFTCPFCNHEKSCEVKMYVFIIIIIIINYLIKLIINYLTGTSQGKQQEFAVVFV